MTKPKSTGSNFTFSGTGVPGATVSLFDGTSPFQGGTPVDGTGNWSSSFSVDSFLVGSHTLAVVFVHYRALYLERLEPQHVLGHLWEGGAPA